MNELNILITAIGAIVLFLGLVSDYFRRNWWTSDPLTALLLGILLGPIALGLVKPSGWGIPKEQIHRTSCPLYISDRIDGGGATNTQKLFFPQLEALGSPPGISYAHHVGG